MYPDDLNRQNQQPGSGMQPGIPAMSPGQTQLQSQPPMQPQGIAPPLVPRQPIDVTPLEPPLGFVWPEQAGSLLPGQGKPAGNPMPFVEPQLPNPAYYATAKASRSRKLLAGFLALIFLALLIAWLIPGTRQVLVNSLGLSQNIQVMTVLADDLHDSQSDQLQALKSIQVNINGTDYTTHASGVAIARKLPYGTVRIAVSQSGFKPVTYTAELPFGLLGSSGSQSIRLALAPNGDAITFQAVDWLTGQPVTQGEFSLGDVRFKPDAKGLVKVYLLDDSQAGAQQTSEKIALKATFKSDYQNKTFELDQSQQHVALVPAGKHYYFGGADEQFSVYSSDLDGTNPQVIVKGTPSETNAAELSVSPDGNYGVLASARDAAKGDATGAVQRAYIVDLKTKKLTRIDEGQNISFGGWSGNLLIYRVSKTEASGAVAVVLRSVDVTKAQVATIETASNSANLSPLAIAFDKLAYLREDTQGPASEHSPQLKIASLQGAEPQVIGQKVIPQQITQLEFGKLTFQSQADLAWHQHNMATGQDQNIAQPDVNLSNTISYGDMNPGKTKRIYVQGDGGAAKALGVEDIKTGQKTQLVPPNNFTRSIRWLNNSVLVFSLVINGQTADYAVSTEGGSAKKIRDWPESGGFGAGG